MAHTGSRRSLLEETFVRVVTRSGARWVRSELGTEALRREVAALRCGLDGALRGEAGTARGCAYEALFGQVADLIKGKHLLVVPSNA
jgi:hypothetical protein